MALDCFLAHGLINLLPPLGEYHRRTSWASGPPPLFGDEEGERGQPYTQGTKEASRRVALPRSPRHANRRRAGDLQRMPFSARQALDAIPPRQETRWVLISYRCYFYGRAPALTMGMSSPSVRCFSVANGGLSSHSGTLPVRRVKSARRRSLNRGKGRGWPFRVWDQPGQYFLYKCF